MNRTSGTLKDIAEALNLSSGTVSRVLNGRGDLAQETRAKVFSLAAELNYLPRRRAAAVQNTATRIALCIGNPCTSEDGTLDPSYVGFHLLAGVQKLAANSGIGVMIAFVDAMAADAKFDDLPMLRRGETQGVILAYPFPEAVVRRLAATRPTVSIEHLYPGSSLDVIGPTHALDVMSAVEHLHQLGHRRIAYVGDESAQGHKLTLNLRQAGFISGLSRCGLTYRDDDVLNVGANVVSKDRLPTAIAGRVRNGVTAVVSSIDRHAYLLWERLPALGLAVPKDVSLIGIGGVHRAPGQQQLTTWRCDYEGIAAAAIKALQTRLIQNDRPDLYSEIKSVFVPGHSASVVRSELFIKE